MNVQKLECLIEAYARANADYAHARGLWAGLRGEGSFLITPDVAIGNYAQEAITAEKALYDYIHGSNEKGE